MLSLACIDDSISAMNDEYAHDGGDSTPLTAEALRKSAQTVLERSHSSLAVSSASTAAVKALAGTLPRVTHHSGNHGQPTTGPGGRRLASGGR